MTLIWFILILGVTVTIHEFGHFIFAKKAGVYVYEFSIGMGPRIIKWKRKNDETEYSIRLLPIGGFVQMAGEEVEDDKTIPKNMKMYNKTFGQKLMIVLAGIIFNFLLAIILLFFLGLFNGVPNNQSIVGHVDKSYPAYTAGLQEDDKILKMNGKSANTIDELSLQLQVNLGKKVDLEVERNGKVQNIEIDPKKVKVDGEETYKYGFSMDSSVKHGFFEAIGYAFIKTFSLIYQMVFVIFYLITGTIGFNSLAGPVGIFGVVGDAAHAGFASIVYLTAFISINVGFINLLPIPAFDGCRALFIIIEKIKGSPVNPKLENTIHAIGFFLLMALMILITYNDIIRLIK